MKGRTIAVILLIIALIMIVLYVSGVLQIVFDAIMGLINGLIDWIKNLFPS